MTGTKCLQGVVIFGFGAILGIWGGCRAPSALKSQDGNSVGEDRANEPVVSLRGEPLWPRPLEEARRLEFEAKLDDARRSFLENPRDVDTIIWLGRRTAYLGRYREAVEIYTSGLRLFPDSAKLFRHRGHRFLTLREIDRAIEDLERATELIRGEPDEVEPDGLPNPANLPTSTNHSNIWYHLGLAYYVKGDFERALRCYRECLRFAAYSHDMLCATSYWTYMTCRRLGLGDEAERAVESIDRSMKILENFAYHELVGLFRGDLLLDAIWPPEGGESVARATLAYGIGNWHLINGREDEAFRIFEGIMDGGEWPAFGYLAAEAELAREGR